jgi:hypothetical protein
LIRVYKKNLKIPKGSETVIRRKTDNTMATKKRTNHNLQNITQKTKDRATRTPLKISGVAKIIIQTVSTVIPSIARLTGTCIQVD